MLKRSLLLSIVIENKTRLKFQLDILLGIIIIQQYIYIIANYILKIMLNDNPPTMLNYI